MYLMNGDRAVLQFDIDEMYVKVLDNDFLPLALKDYVRSPEYATRIDFEDAARYIACIKDYLCSRVLTLRRANAKAILDAAGFPQTFRTKQALEIVRACNGLSITDNFWVKDEGDSRTFREVNLRNQCLKDAAFSVSIEGMFVPLSKEVMAPDIGTNGQFAKTWYRGASGIFLWKADKTTNCVNTRAEKQVSDILDHSNVKHVKYQLFDSGNRVISSCKCLANDAVSLVDAFAVQDWCRHTNKDFLKMLESFHSDFAKMCVIDYVLANTDRHLGNIQFLVDNSTNQIVGMAPLFDHNQALLADMLPNGFDESLIYDATGLSMWETAAAYFELSGLEIDEEALPEKCLQRLRKLSQK